MLTTDSEKQFIDFIAELPYDIIPTILCDLSTNQLAECLTVSPIWNSRLLNSASLWRDVRISEVETSFVKSLERVTPFIRKLTVCDDADLEATFRLLSNCNFDSLRSLALELELPESSVYHDYIYPALGNVGGHLEEVSFAYLDCAQIPFARILDYCPSLERMKFNGYGSDIEPKPTTNDTISKLTHAFIHIDTDVDPGELRRLLQRTPKLQQLHISYCKSEILDIVFECCPDLPLLNYNMAAIQTQNDVRMEFADFHVGDDEERGMRVLNVAGKSGAELLNIAQFTQRSMVLEEFGFYENWGSQAIPDLTRFASKNLQRFYCDAPLDSTTLSSIVSQCPLVQDIMVTRVNVECLLLLITKCTRLRRLHLIQGSDIEEQDMQRFLTSCQLSNSLTLSTLVLEDCVSLTDTTIGYLPDLPTLHEIALKRNDNVTEVGMNAFAEKLQHSNVRRIRLELMDSVTDVTLAILGAGRLEAVSLLGLDHVMFHGLCELVNHAPSLRQLHVFQCGVIPDSALSTFKGIKVCTTESLP